VKHKPKLGECKACTITKIERTHIVLHVIAAPHVQARNGDISTVGYYNVDDFIRGLWHWKWERIRNGNSQWNLTYTCATTQATHTRTYKHNAFWIIKMSRWPSRSPASTVLEGMTMWRSTFPNIAVHLWKAISLAA